MKKVKALFCLLGIALLGSAVLPGARADESNKKTVVTFSQAVEVPGKILPAGTYTFKLMDSPADRHIVQIFNADGTQIITTILAINNYRLQPTGDNFMKFSERPGDAPEALRAWFYPGDTFGQEFVYPKVRAIQLAQTSKEAIPAVAADTLDDNAMRTAPIVAVTPEQKEVEVNTAIQTTPVAETAPTPAPVVAEVQTPAPVVQASTPAHVDVTQAKEKEESEELPQTASSVPLIALLGALSIGLAIGIKLVLKLA